MNGTDKYHLKVKVIDKIVSTKISLKKEHDELMVLKSKTIKKGREVSQLRNELNDHEDDLVELYSG